MANIEKLTPNEDNKDELHHLAKKEAELDSQKKKAEMPREFGSYENLVAFAKDEGGKLEELVSARADLEAGTPEHELLSQKIGAARGMLPKVLTKIALADEANAIAIANENDPDFVDNHTKPIDYTKVETQNA